MKDWFIQYGEFKEAKNKLFYTGKKTELQLVNTNETKIVPEIGLVIYAKKFTNGKIIAEVEFKNIEDGFPCSCYFVFNNSNVNGKIERYEVGICKLQNKLQNASFSYREFNGKE